ncbi:putative alpha beta hydrolase [Zalerion maritima]|uniref:Alpha beta hydrolase n=1 Tax=Zalerion maritima TaxID=339359 RepID=A0AAD5RF06_9PEZI|nr:putative alpha beta hydrolase [Zalerion maritima]
MSGPGILYVTMQPQEGLHPAQFHEWYNNEHGPTRLKLPRIFTNGLRYRATDGQSPEVLAVYDVTSMSHLETTAYTCLRANRSPREAETIDQVKVNRSFYDLGTTAKSDTFRPIEQLTNDEAEGLVLVAVTATLKNIAGAEKEYLKWYEEEHIPMLSKVPGWLRTRLFQTSTLESAGEITYLALHDYAKQNGLGGPQYKAAVSTEWRDEVAKYIETKGRRTYELFYIFGSGSTDLSNLSKLPAGTPTFTSQDGQTTTVPGASPSIESFIPTKDGLVIPYRLEGNPDPKAPTVAFSNSLLTSLRMWDAFVAILKKARPDLRILRYDTRGRHSIPQPPVAANLDMLADDISSLLDGLRISKLQALVGVSMGGATTLKFALKNPERLSKFVACDFNVASSAANTEGWKSRIQVAETPTEDGKPGITNLAGATVERWYHPRSMKKPCAPWMVGMVAANDVEGFRYSCQALWDYDMKPQMKGCKVPGLLVVGEADGKGALVKAMDGFKGLVGEGGVPLNVVPEAGHLPMCENPQGFWDAIKDFV